MATDAIRSDQAKLAVIGMTDPEPHALSVGTFYGARVLSHDGQVSKPFIWLGQELESLLQICEFSRLAKGVIGYVAMH